MKGVNFGENNGNMYLEALAERVSILKKEIKSLFIGFFQEKKLIFFKKGNFLNFYSCLDATF